MGTDKSQLLFAGDTLSIGIAGELASVTTFDKAGRRPRASDQTQPANRRGRFIPAGGALGGVPLRFHLCCRMGVSGRGGDFPFVTRQLFTKLASVRANFDAVAPIQNDGIPQPLCNPLRAGTLPASGGTIASNPAERNLLLCYNL